jgi:hypothetical protein
MVFHNNKQARLIILLDQLKMSFQNNTFKTNAPKGAYNKVNGSAAIKPFCNVCKAVGKESNNHFTRSKPGPDGVIVCPYLLSIECEYCHEKGHTPKYCPKSKDNRVNGSAAIKPFCNVCKAAGKEYNNHFTRSKPGPDGVIVCPHLLSIECGYCHEKGHTPKYCPRSKANMEREQYNPTAAVLKTPERPKPSFIPSAPARPTQKKATMFDCLDLDEDEFVTKPALSSNRKTAVESLGFPALVPMKQAPKQTKQAPKQVQAPKQTKQAPVTSMWAQMAAKPAPVEKPEFDYERKRAIELAKEEQYQKEQHIKRCNRIATHAYSELAQKAVEEHKMEEYVERQNAENMSFHGDDETEFDDNWTWY